ncbi:hypothetical protein MUP50_00830, partial [Patescibacteria group bacterium]|nr:hypothetical protein [Patescibacteria group bacterium]
PVLKAVQVGVLVPQLIIIPPVGRLLVVVLQPHHQLHNHQLQPLQLQAVLQDNGTLVFVRVVLITANGLKEA